LRAIRRGLVAGFVWAFLVVALLWAFGPRIPAGREPPSTDAAPRDRPVARALDSDHEILRARGLYFPVEGVRPRDVRDSFAEARSGHPHEALDIFAPRGTRVLAVDHGKVEKLFTSVRGGLTVYQFDAGGRYCYYYAHLDRYAEGLQEGAVLAKGSLVGYVGTTGNARKGLPHLHFAVFKLGPEKHWWEGTALNPFGLWPEG
jgi:peptidoglycan LD-endopeptidase LytH